MKRLLEQLRLMMEMLDKGELTYKSYDLKVRKQIKWIKEYDAKHPFANLGLPTEDYKLLQEVLKS